ncbi:MAG TPA: hypothetical protein VGL13_01010, partial [Polyangiaceae bacterium]
GGNLLGEILGCFGHGAEDSHRHGQINGKALDAAIESVQAGFGRALRRPFYAGFESPRRRVWDEHLEAAAASR